MDLIKISSEIESRIRSLERGRKLLRDCAMDKAQTIANYEKEIAKTLIGLKNGKEFNLEGEVIKNPPASTAEKISRGICYQEKLKAEESEALYRNAIVGMRALESEMQGYQSIFRHLEEKGE